MKPSYRLRYTFAELFRPNFSEGSLNLNFDSPAFVVSS
jgi:hypothetical protein